LPEAIARQLRVSGEVNTLEVAIIWVKLLMTIDSQPVATIEEKPNGSSEMQQLRDQMALLTEQVATLSAHKGSNYQSQRKNRSCCFGCNQLGYIQLNCLAQHRVCFYCCQPGHLARNCWYQGNEQRTPVLGNRHPCQQ